MSSNNPNAAGLTSGQQSELMSILAGTWPPLKPLPVFKYETLEYRATIDFDRKRGEWVCRKTSLPSNQVQELRGGLREITMALPRDSEMLTEEGEPLEQELEKDKTRRLQAIHDWREKYENGARYFQLRDHLSESQRVELDASLRLSLTARQLQFTSKNVATVFDDLSIAGGRFATLIEFAERIKAKQTTTPKPQGVMLESEQATDHNEQAEGPSASTDAFPVLSIKDIFPQQEQAPFADRTAHDASRRLEPDIADLEHEISDIVNAQSSSPAEDPHHEGRLSTLAGFPTRVQMSQQPTDRIEGSSSRFSFFKISEFQIIAFALLFLFAITAFTVGLTLGRRPLGTRVEDAAKPLLAAQAQSPGPSAQANESTSRTPNTPRPSSSDLAGANRLDADPPQVKSDQSLRAPDFAEGRADPYGLTSDVGVTPHLSRPSIALVDVPSRGQPFRVNFPKKAIAATSSFAMTSQLSVLVSPKPGPVPSRATRLETGELVSFVWPRYPRPADRNGTIRVRATIGQLGQVLDVKFLSGSSSLLPPTVRAIHQWRFRPTLLGKRPVQAQQDVTIEFRPQQYSSRLSHQHSFPN